MGQPPSPQRNTAMPAHTPTRRRVAPRLKRDRRLLSLPHTLHLAFVVVNLLLLRIAPTGSGKRRGTLLAVLTAAAQEAPNLSDAQEELHDDDGMAHSGPGAHPDPDDPGAVVDDPDGDYEKMDDPAPEICDDGLGPNPNIMHALPDKDKDRDAGATDDGEQENDEEREEAALPGLASSMITRVVKRTVKKFTKYDMTTGRLWAKPPAERIPMCPGAKARSPIPGIDCSLEPAPHEKITCCDCGCDCCSLLRRVVKRSVNKFSHIDMDTGKPFKKLPPCNDYEEPVSPKIKERPNQPLKTMLKRKVAEDNARRKAKGMLKRVLSHGATVSSAIEGAKKGYETFRKEREDPAIAIVNAAQGGQAEGEGGINGSSMTRRRQRRRR